ncbi:hypothetical protein EAX61_13440 [Dokdonia sinensis]|uniref:Tyr recombinase domain-containing protein n=1 Tax=Dokdonia sinensis TaxID=2479847 RepID=A0A3M0FV87_9FLAO|nr:hypothetical protein EAX61_13440 [Dokdonia sinensis]
MQELLGHGRPETTMIYTQVTNKDLQQIRSPLDNGLNGLSLRDNDNNSYKIT